MTKRAKKAAPKKKAPAPGKGQRSAIFAREYLVDHNATQAAIRAGYSPRSAEVTGCRLLRDAKVRAFITEAVAERYTRLDITAERIAWELAASGFFDMRKLLNPDGTVKPPQEWDDQSAAAVASLEVLEEYRGRGSERVLVGQTKKIRLVEKTRSLELLGKTLGMFKERHEVSGPDGAPVPVASDLLAGLDLSALSLDELRTLQALRDKAQARQV